MYGGKGLFLMLSVAAVISQCLSEPARRKWMHERRDDSRSKEASTSKPNIIVLLADDMGYADVVTYGNPQQEWGAIDDFAMEGLRFTNGYVGDSVCTPSRTAFITGRLPARVGVYGETRVFLPWTSTGLPKEEVTIAEAMQSAGYTTGMVGKWHLGINEKTNNDFVHLPHNHGFDYVGHNLPFTNSWNCDDTGIHLAYPDTSKCYLFYNTTSLQQPFNHTYLTKHFVDDAVSFINDNRDGPFFLYVAFAHMHTSLFSSPEYTGSSKRGRYGDNLNELHWGVGQIVDTVKNLGIQEDTMIFFFSDHGPHREYCEEGGSAGVFRGGKTLSWEGGFRVPYIVWWPGTITPGVNHEIVSSMDIIQTAADFSGATLPDVTYDGYSLRDVLLNGAKSPHEAYFFHCKDKLMAARVGSYKAHYATQEDMSSQGYGERCDAGFPTEDYFLCNECEGDCVTAHDPPLMYNLDKDPEEAYPLDAESEEYQYALSLITTKVDEHMAGWDVAAPLLDTFDHSLPPCCDESTNCVCNFPPPPPPTA